MPRSAERQRELIRHAQTSARLGADELWLRYFAIGGTAGPVELEAFLHQAFHLASDQADLVALAINEHIDATAGKYRAPYSRPLRASGHRDDTLAALRDLLRKTHLVSPASLPEALDGAAAHLGVTTVLYLADYGRQTLLPFPGRQGHGRPALGIDSTLAGRAWQLLTTQTTVSEDGQARLWVPILDGVDRVGVLDVMVTDPREVDDVVLHQQVWTLSHYLGHLITVLDPLGDAADTVRRTQERTIEAELVWTLLPPLTGGTDQVLVTGQLEPAHDVGGDVFDYALSPNNVQFTVIDATGHDLRAGLAAAAGLSAYRNARRSGGDLTDQAQAVHRTITDHYGGDIYATGVFADLDADTGLLRYFSAGHPAPLLVRGGTVVKSLQGGRQPMLGLDLPGAAMGEEQLEPEDIVVVYSDGITEARDAEAGFFGLQRLQDAITGTLSEGHPLPETVRLLFQAILRHQGGVLQDDATLLLVQWTSTAQAALEPTPLRFQ